IGAEDRAGIVLGAVYAIGIAGDGMNVSGAVERHRERKQELDVATATAVAAHGHRGLAAREQHQRKRERALADDEPSRRRLARNSRMYQRHVFRLALDRV